MKMSSIYTIIVLLILTIACTETIEVEQFSLPKTDLTTNTIIPKPNSVIADSSGFALDFRTRIINASKNKDYEHIVSFFKDQLSEATELDSVVSKEQTYLGRSIFFKDASLTNKDNEAYHIKIEEDSIIVLSNSSEGAFRAAQTLLQLIPHKADTTLSDHNIYVIPTGEIVDAPLYSHRGTMLDVARHFFKVEDVKKYIDVLAYYKINVLHLHLSDDQGWRIEIKSWPKLTEIGSQSEVGGGPGGYFTQEDYKEMVDYAAQNFMTIIPEIDMPGHTNAASVSYPPLNGNGKNVTPYTGMRVGFSTFDTRKDSVYIFIDDVIREISELTPGPYFHIGGDESHSTKKEDYIYFVNRVEKIVQKYGKMMIGWDEIATANVDSTSISQFWQNDKNALLAKQKNMKIIYSPAKKAYLDMKYDSSTKLGLTWAGQVPVDSSYIWSPSKYVSGIDSDHILGVEAPLWSETISTLEELQFLAFPRVIGIAEIGWSQDDDRNWEDYKRRLAAQYTYLKRHNVNFFETPKIDWDKSIDSSN